MKIFRFKSFLKIILIKIFMIFSLLNNTYAQDVRENLWRAYYFCEKFSECLKIIGDIEKDFEVAKTTKEEFIELWYYKAVLLASSYKEEDIFESETLFLKIINDQYLIENPNNYYYYSNANLGWMYHTETLVFNPEKAVKLMTVAANQNLPTAINNLGVFYDRGLGVKRDYKKSFELFFKASELGNHYAHGNIAKYYILGLGGANQNYFKAVNHLKLATISEYGDNDNYLLKLLLSKQKLPKNSNEFILWLEEEAIKNKDNNALIRIGFELDNTEEGYFWFFLCSEFSQIKTDKLRCAQEMKIAKKIFPNQLADEKVKLIEEEALNWYNSKFK